MGARDIFEKLKQTRAAQALQAAATFVADGAKTVPDAVYESRFATCVVCPHFQAGQFPTCAACGCYLKVKCTFPQEQCPVGKWTKWREATGKEGAGCC